MTPPGVEVSIDTLVANPPSITCARAPPRALTNDTPAIPATKYPVRASSMRTTNDHVIASPRDRHASSSRLYLVGRFGGAFNNVALSASSAAFTAASSTAESAAASAAASAASAASATTTEDPRWIIVSLVIAFTVAVAIWATVCLPCCYQPKSDEDDDAPPSYDGDIALSDITAPPAPVYFPRPLSDNLGGTTAEIPLRTTLGETVDATHSRSRVLVHLPTSSTTSSTNGSQSSDDSAYIRHFDVFNISISAAPASCCFALRADSAKPDAAQPGGNMYFPYPRDILSRNASLPNGTQSDSLKRHLDARYQGSLQCVQKAPGQARKADLQQWLRD
ncbi:hypothetical protein K438DRAFT_1981877 [Mycena galopus ATCC 62051]|nr:hypothetical protein K438DRAFT_1981877 [Mycena galopus ATCC 62051]